MPKAAESRCAVSSVGFRFPRSIMLMKVRSKSDNSASFSWDNPCALRASRRTLPNFADRLATSSNQSQGFDQVDLPILEVILGFSEGHFVVQTSLIIGVLS